LRFVIALRTLAMPLGVLDSRDFIDLTQSGLDRSALSTCRKDSLMTKEDCRANALKCYRVAQTAGDREVRRTLLELAVQWRELAAQIDRLHQGEITPPAAIGGPKVLH
jgi:hypothetical protein